MIPYHGTVKWDALMPILAEIGYNGPLIYEINTRGASGEVLDELVKHMKRIGDRLVSLVR